MTPSVVPGASTRTCQVIVALDVASADEARTLVRRLGPELDFVKVGLELFTREGPPAVHLLREEGLRVFLDLKLHDIPNTVAGAVRSARGLDAELLTLHASGGRAMMEAAAQAAGEGAFEGGSTHLTLLAVTLLTSMDGAGAAEAWGRTGDAVEPAAEVRRLAELALGSGVGGVVASPHEARDLRERLGPQAAIVTPGIRFAGGDAHDQHRIATPGDAARAGASHLVLGRAVTGASDPAGALARAREEVAQALEEAS
jgi:orotidine-5'-phosphate decarboxylase